MPLSDHSTKKKPGRRKCRKIRHGRFGDSKTNRASKFDAKMDADYALAKQVNPKLTKLDFIKAYLRKPSGAAESKHAASSSSLDQRSEKTDSGADGIRNFFIKSAERLASTQKKDPDVQEK